VINRLQEPVLCIDFGLDRLSVLAVSAGGVIGSWTRDLPPRIVRNGDPIEPAQVADLIKQALREAGLAGVRARFTLPDEVAILRTVELPAMPQRHLQRALEYMVDKDVPLPLERICWDWDILEKTDIGYRICLVATWRDVIERIRRVAQEAGLRLELVEPRSLAIARALDRDRIVVFEGSSERLQALYLRRGAIPFVDQAPIGRDLATCARTLERLLRRGRSAEDKGVEGEIGVLSGDLEDLELALAVPTVPVSQVLNVPARPGAAGIRAGRLLANLGLGHEVMHRFSTNRTGIADVNLLGHGSHRQPWQRRLTRLRRRSHGERLATTSAQQLAAAAGSG
jgi:hypothetical protein